MTTMAAKKKPKAPKKPMGPGGPKNPFGGKPAKKGGK